KGIVAQIAERLASFIQCEPEMNSGIVQALEHLILIGAGGADRRFNQRGNTDAALHNGVMHLSRDACPLRQTEVIAVPCLPLLKMECTSGTSAHHRKRERVEPAGLIE